MSLKEHKVKNVNISNKIVEKIKKIGNDISNGLRNCGKLKYGIASKDGIIWTEIKRRNFFGTYSKENGECLLFNKEDINDRILYHDLVNNRYYTEAQYMDIISGSTEREELDSRTIESYVDEENDIFFKPVLPVVYATGLKAKIEDSKNQSTLRK